MSTHCFIFSIRKGIGLASLAFLSALGVLGMVVPTLLFSSPLAGAFSLRHAASPPLTEDVGRAGVSVVRLLLTYSTLTTPPSSFQCSGLGTIVASWPAQSPTDQNTWVLTDGALVKQQGEVGCLLAHPKARLDSIVVHLSTAYNPKAGEQGNLISLLATPTSPLTIQCAAPEACQNGPALLAFATPQALPFIDQVAEDLAQADSSGIELSQKAESLVMPAAFNTDAKAVPSYTAQVLQSTIPSRAKLNRASSTTPLEPGLPLVDVHGKLLNIMLRNAQPTSQQLSSFLNHQPALRSPPANPVHDHWQAGISAFYQGPGHYAQAHSEFQAVLNANPQFLGVQTFLHFTAPTAGSASPPNGFSQLISDYLSSSHSTLPLLALGSLILVGIIILLALITLLRRHARQKRLQEEYAEAERIATTTLEEERRKQQQLWAQQRSQKAWSEQPTLTPETAPYAFQQSTTSPLPCPHCQKPVQPGTTRCPYCGTSMLLPTDSGFYPRTQLVTPSSASGSLSVSENQPTIEMSPGMQMSPSTTRNGLTDSDKTQADLLRQANNQNVGFGVITRTDPGIKRKHKPNEDSLFAAQGTREANSSLQQVGLFVVADGMGGHANGQDASRLAIQTIINYILPKLAHNGEVTGNAFQQLLIDGVQCANQAVHQRNMEQRADMGTTMTAALIVAPIGVTYAEDDTRPPTAIGYIANVGDSRTYLYRQGRGLVKLTNDHSVVASLVEAGIIRPDDIYTHPKRNQIYRSLGEKPAVEVDSFVVALEVDDKLLLCSDGLWDMVRDPQIEEVLKNPAPPTMTGDALIQAAINGGGEDNISVIVVQIPDPNRLNARLGIQLIDKPEAVQMPQL